MTQRMGAERDAGGTRREWWIQREGYFHAPFGVEIVSHEDGSERVVRATPPIGTLEPTTIAPGDELAWHPLTEREQAQTASMANDGYAFARLTYTRDAAGVLKVAKRDSAHLKRRPVSPEAKLARRRLEEAARDRARALTSADLERRRRELAIEESEHDAEHSFRWCALSDEAQRRGFPHLDPQKRRGVPLHILEEDFPDHAEIYARRRRAE